jgi:hypothetical protein
MVIFYGDSSNNQIDFRFNSQAPVEFNTCDPVANILVNGNLLYLSGVSNGRPSYANTPYRVSFTGSPFSRWEYIVSGILTDSGNVQNYPWQSSWVSGTIVERSCG